MGFMHVINMCTFLNIGCAICRSAQAGHHDRGLAFSLAEKCRLVAKCCHAEMLGTFLDISRLGCDDPAKKDFISASIQCFAYYACSYQL